MLLIGISCRTKCWIHLLAIGTAIFFAVVLGVANIQLHLSSTSLVAGDQDRERAILEQLRHLQEANDRGAPYRMQAIYPEGFFFQHVLTGLAWCDLGRSSRDRLLRSEASSHARQALRAIESFEGTRIFPLEARPRYGVFWTAWTNLLRGRILDLDGVESDSVLFLRWRGSLDSLAEVYAGSENPYQPSYVGMAWSGDNVMAMLALADHDRFLDTNRYQALRARWVGQVRSSLDPSTGMPPFEVEHPSGRVEKSARGSSQTLLAWALTEIDTVFAREQYQRLCETFFTRRMGLPVVREFPADSAIAADYDSGPVVWGVGASATIVTLATARRYGDTSFARALESTIRFFGFPVSWNGRTAFAFGQMPVADAWIAWSRCSLPSSAVHVPRQELSSVWFLPIHLISLLVLAIVWGVWFRFLRPGLDCSPT